MNKRPFIKLSIQELEKVFAEERSNMKTINLIFAELSHRRTPRAKALRRRVLQVLALNALATGEKHADPKHSSE
jgi:hypothetical protein